MNPWNTIQKLEAEPSTLAKQVILEEALSYIAESTGTVADYSEAPLDKSVRRPNNPVFSLPSRGASFWRRSRTRLPLC